MKCAVSPSTSSARPATSPDTLAQTLRVNQEPSPNSRSAPNVRLHPASYLKAMGAELQIRAIFPDGEVVIEQFEDLDTGRNDPPRKP